ncbi:hypothetical protein NDU88_001682 [Pleurodeles waltl]|uniref:Uncharacterized protein n=1 Tax=Pleurodeles waltl TaxID=8319 RepID=A0AAV7P684_PLEWA|nr:hypothetical protein NDU88_001682 [Pleurodeles waltl]
MGHATCISVLFGITALVDGIGQQMKRGRGPRHLLITKSYCDSLRWKLHQTAKPRYLLTQTGISYCYESPGIGGSGLAAIYDGRLRARRWATRRGRRRWRRTRGPPGPAGASVEVGEGERPTPVARGSTLPGDAEQSERGKFEARSRPPSRGLECGVTPARSDASPAGARGRGTRPPLLPAPWWRLVCGPWSRKQAGAPPAPPSLPVDQCRRGRAELTGATA